MDPPNQEWLVKMCQLVTLVASYQIMLINVLLAYRQRRRRRLRMIMAYRRMLVRRRVLMFLALRPPRVRRMWKRERSQDWWNVIVPNFDDEQWLENFRVRRVTFEYICDSVRVILAPNPNQFVQNHCLSVEKIVAIALYKLAHVAEYKVVGNQFGVHKSTVHNCLYAFCLALIEARADQLIRMPNDEEAREIADRFEAKTHIPQMIGAIDGSHIPITAPEDGHADFVNRKGGCSIILQAVVDDQYIFRDISCKCPGACHDADALRESGLYQNIDTMMPKGVKSVEGEDIPFFLAGDPAYPLLPWLLKNFTYDANISREMDSFNGYFNSGRVVVENAFGRLKGRWRVLLKRAEIFYEFVPTVVAACCILHNICEMGRETFNHNWLVVADEQAEADCVLPERAPFDADNEPEAADIREHITRYLARNFELKETIRGRYARY